MRVSADSSTGVESQLEKIQSEAKSAVSCAKDDFPTEAEAPDERRQHQGLSG
jgi:hypothetical protein